MSLAVLTAQIQWTSAHSLADAAGFWSGAARETLGHLLSPDVLSFGQRLHFAPNGAAATTFTLCTAASRAQALSSFAHTVQRYEGSGVQVRLMRDAAPFIFSSPAVRLQAQTEELACPGGAAVLSSMDLTEIFGEILGQAARYDADIALETVVRPFTAAVDVLRAARYNRVQIERERGLPSTIRSAQLEMVERLDTSDHVAEHAIVLSQEQPGGGEVVALLERALGDTVYARFGGTPKLVRIGSQRAGGFARLIHYEAGMPVSTSNRTAGEQIVNAVRPEDLERIHRAAWLPVSPYLSALQQDAAVRLAQRSRPAANSPAPDALFISYARKDQDEMFRLVAALEDRGVTCWVDRSMQGGEDWLATLEQGVAGTRGLIALITPNYVASTYCRREIAFADQNKKPLIALTKPGTELSGGLGLLLTTGQLVRLDDPLHADRVAHWARQLPRR